MIGYQTSDSNHSKASILELLHPHLLLLGGICRPKLKIIHSRRAVSQEGLAILLLLEFPSLEDSTDHDPLGPPLRVGLEDGIDGVGGGHILGVEGSEDLGEEPADGGKHGGTAVGEFGSTGPIDWDVVAEAEWVKLKKKRYDQINESYPERLDAVNSNSKQ